MNDVLTTTDPMNVETTNTYNARGDLLTTSTPLVGSSPPVSQTVTNTYADPSHPGDVTSVTDPDNHVWTKTYDAGGDLASTTDPLGDVTQYCSNAIGQVTETVGLPPMRSYS